jgi:phospholipid/cholesterol/gamma-HCH transport system substrate-binding protein
MKAHQPHPHLTRTIAKVAVFTALSAVLTSVVFSSLLDVSGTSTNTYTAEFSNASGLQPGDTVRIAGVEVGKVAAVTLDGNHADVVFSVATTQHLTTATRAAVHFENLLGQRFLAILQGAPGSAPLPPGGVIPVSRTTPAIDLTAVFDGFEPLFSALAPGQVNQLAGSIIQVFQGESGTVNDLVEQTAVITNNLADRQVVIDGLLTSLASLLDTVGVHDSQLGQLIGNFDTLVRGLAGSRSALSSAISNVSSLETTTSGLLGQAQPSLDQDIQHLATDVQTLSANQKGLDTLLTGFPGLVGALTKIQSTGNWINVYLCNLTIDVQGRLDISLVPGVSPPRYPDPVTLPSGKVGDQLSHTASCS